MANDLPGRDSNLEKLMSSLKRTSRCWLFKSSSISNSRRRTLRNGFQIGSFGIGRLVEPVVPVALFGGVGGVAIKLVSLAESDSASVAGFLVESVLDVSVEFFCVLGFEDSSVGVSEVLSVISPFLSTRLTSVKSSP